MSFEPIRIFIASPSDVDSERDCLKKNVIERWNDTWSGEFGVFLQALDWREHVHPVMGRPQEEILEQLGIESTDIVIIILWRRFGSYSGKLHPETLEPLTGLHEEFVTAYKLYNDYGKPEIMVYHCLRHPSKSDESRDWEQRKMVQEFLDRFRPGEQHPGIVKKYKTLRQFETMVYDDLSGLITKKLRESPAHGPALEPITPSLPSDVLPWDAGITDVGWDERDNETLIAYLEDRKEYESICEDLLGELGADDPKEKVRQFLETESLLARDPDRGWRFTYAGAILFARTRVNLKDCHRAVDFYERRRIRHEVPVELRQDDLSMYAVFGRALTWLQTELELPPDDDLMHYAPYPRIAVFEALVNWIAHRDYRVWGEGKITIYRERVEFFNPGHSEFDADELIHSTEALRGKRRRNPVLVNVLRSVRLVQRQGHGMYRIRQALLDNRSYHEARAGMAIKNDPENNTFTLTIYRAKPEDQKTEQRLVALEGELRSAREVVQRLQQDLDDKKAALEKALRDLKASRFSELTITIRELKDKLNAAGEQVAGLQEDVDEKEKTIETLRLELTKAEDSKARVLDESASVQRDLTERLTRTQELVESQEEKLRKIEADISALEENLSSLGLERDRALEERDAKAEDVERLEQSVAQAHRELDTLRAEWETERADLNKEIADTHAELERVTADRDELQQQVQTGSQKLDGLQQELRDVTNKMDQAVRSEREQIRELETRHEDGLREREQQISFLTHLLKRVRSRLPIFYTLSVFGGLSLLVSVIVILVNVSGIADVRLSWRSPEKVPALEAVLNVLDNVSPVCNSDGSWTIRLHLEGSGGDGIYTYYWNSQRIGGSTENGEESGVTFPVSRTQGRAIEGVGIVVSGDGQLAASEIYIPAPDCQ